MLNPPHGDRARSEPEVARTPTIGVLHLYRRFHPDFTGDGIYYQKLFALFAERGVSQDVLVYEAPEVLGESWREQQQRPHHNVVYLAPPGKSPSALTMCAWLWRNRRRYQVLHVHTHVDRRFCFYLFARLLGLGVIYSSTLEDSALDLIRGYRPRWRWLVRKLLRAFDVLVAISPHLFEGNLAAFPPDRATFIPQGVAAAVLPTPQERAILRQRLGIAPPSSSASRATWSSSRRKWAAKCSASRKSRSASLSPSPSARPRENSPSEAAMNPHPGNR